MELADKLLAFKDDRQALIATLQHIYAELGMDLPTLDSGGIPTDIDPFTVYGLFNRGLATAKRWTVARGIGGALGVRAPLHDDFVGVPTLLNINATLYDQARRGDGDIERLWDLFAVALVYADRPTEQTGGGILSRVRCCSQTTQCQLECHDGPFLGTSVCLR